MEKLNNTFAVGFYLKKSKENKEGKCPIVAKITLNGQRIEIATKQYLEESKWNTAKGLARGSNEEIKRFNVFLDRFKVSIIEAYQEMVLKKLKITLPLLKNAVLGTQTPGNSLLSLIEYHNDKEGEMLEWGTMKNYQTTQKYLLDFVKKQYRLSDLPRTQLPVHHLISNLPA